METNVENNSATHEQNGEAFYSDEDEEPAFEVFFLNENEKKTAIAATPYCKKWYEKSGIDIKQMGRVDLMFNKRKVLGLFYLFMNRSFFNWVQTWTTEEMSRKGLLNSSSYITRNKLEAYVGLEMAMPICRFNQITDYWNENMFLGNDHFGKVMKRNDFQTLRA